MGSQEAKTTSTLLISRGGHEGGLSLPILGYSHEAMAFGKVLVMKKPGLEARFGGPKRVNKSSHSEICKHIIKTHGFRGPVKEMREAWRLVVG
jgi:hypothetical protein